MAKTSNAKKNDRKMAGYDPAQYSRITVMFIILSLVNVLFVILAFMRTGYGLYHAEEALSRVSKVTQCVHVVNESAQDIVIYWNNPDRITEETANISEAFQELDKQSAEYRDIKLDDIDKSLKNEFEMAAQNVTDYRNTLNEFITSISTDGKADPGQIASSYEMLIEPSKLKAESSMNSVFARQSKATQEFFFRSAQQFLFVLLFLIIVLFIGIAGISRMRKNARAAAESLEQEHEKVERQREKTMNLAYCNILTGFKNYYGMEKDLIDRISTEEISIILCRFNKFGQINEVYGRDRTDEFVTQVSQELTNAFTLTTDIYSTGNDEFCFVLHEKADSEQAEKIARKIADTLSKSYMVGDAVIQQTVSCCHYLCSPDAQSNFSQMFCTLDRAMSVAKAKSTASGENVFVNVNSLS